MKRHKCIICKVRTCSNMPSFCIMICANMRRPNQRICSAIVANLFIILPNDAQNGLIHTRKCIKMRGNEPKYWSEYALMLQQQNEKEEAFQTALKLSNYQNTKILKEYGKFLMNEANQKERGRSFLQLASALNPNKTDECQPQDDDIDDTKNNDDINDGLNVSSVMLNISNNTENYQSLKYVTYSFDRVVTYWTLYDALHGDLSHLFTLDDLDFVRLFGDRDRIRRLSHHFQALKSKGIKLILHFVNLNAQYSDIVHESLKRAYLHKYFHQIIQIDKESEINQKLHSIKTLKQRHNLNENEILFIDDNRKVIERMRRHCFSIFVPESKGLTLRDIKNIESNLNIPTTNYTTFNAPIPSSALCVIDRTIYYEIRTQIIRAPYDGTIDNLEIIQYIRNNWHSEPYKDAFLEYAAKYSLLCYHLAKFNSWLMDALCDTLLGVSPFDADANSKKGTALSTMGDIEGGEKFHHKSSRGRYITAISNYAFFLFKQHRYEETLALFERALRINPLNIKSIIGKGRTLWRLGNIDEAIYFYKRAAAVDPSHDMAHIRLGGLYRDLGRYQEAKEEYLIANELWSYSYKTKYMLALTCKDLNDMKEFEHYLEKCLDLNPEYQPAKDRDYRNFDHYYCPSGNAKNYMLNGGISKPRCREAPRNSEKEFEIFWFDKLEMWVGPKFAEYLQLFVHKGLNNVDCLFALSMNKLKEIGIANQEHIKIIMDAVDRIVIDEHNEFREWIGSIVCDQRILTEYIDSFMNFKLPIYSIQSFFRNVSAIAKLRSIIGGRNRFFC